ncbi:MAG: hypothetical protein V1774_00780, partial [Candidatus Eisenbacteria bacterium]
MAAERPVNRIFRTAVYVAAGAFLLLYLLVALQRIAYPWELEWMEGGLVDHVQRIVNGQGIYV